MLVEALQTYLAADDVMRAQLGTPSQRKNNNSGIFPVLAPDGEQVPYLIVSEVTGNPLQESMRGTGRLLTERWRFSCFGSTYKQAKRLAKALSNALLAMNGALTEGSAYIEGSWKKLEADDAEPLAKGTLYSCHVDFEISYIDLDADDTDTVINVDGGTF